MKSDIQTIKKFNAIRYAIISFMAIGFLGGYFLNFLPESHKYLSVFYILIYVAILFLSIVKMYRCPFCSRIPLGHPMPYVDLSAKSCRACGHSFLRSHDTPGKD